MPSIKQTTIAGLGLAAVLTAAAVLGLSRGVGPTEVRAGTTSSASASALLRDPAGRPVGQVTFIQQGERVAIEAALYGLAPGFHGFHVHAVGRCDLGTDPVFSSAGGHFDPHGHSHGHHAGDLPVLLVGADGVATLSFVTDGFAVVELFDADGSTVIVHAAPDNYANIAMRYAPNGPDATTLATGDAGGRVACGRIE